MINNNMTLLVDSNQIETIIHGDEFTFKIKDDSHFELSSQTALWRMTLALDSHAQILGDGFQMLAQTGGRIDQPHPIGRCPDNNGEYRIYPIDAPQRYYNYLVIQTNQDFCLMGFSSCQRFAGYFEIEPQADHYAITAYLDGEELLTSELTNRYLESLVVIREATLDAVFSRFSNAIARHHTPCAGTHAQTPVGWCSWYAYYANVTQDHIAENLEAMQDAFAEIEWVLLDDGYQAHMGDWLTPSNKFPDGIDAVIANIRAKGKKPAIWIAPFIADKDSELLSNHPDWFVTHSDGKLLKAEEITYGGWRCTPWFILDTSHPEVQAHLTSVVRKMREQWGVELFKLDANYWGTLKGQRFANVTGIEAYRMGMEAIRRGAGEAWLLGCNAPMWPSLGLVDAMRVSDDVERFSGRFEQIAKENFCRSWQHQRLWQIDPDCATFTSLPNQAAEYEAYDFHRNALLASGGLLLSGDPLPDASPLAVSSWQKLVLRQSQNSANARFDDLHFHHATLTLNTKETLHCAFNYHYNGAQTLTLQSQVACNWFDYWSGEKLNSEPTALFELSLPSGLAARSLISRAI
ncbi:glycosyl hydrolase [Vibrio sp. SM6]|uniref:Glycosyl hydrolase n=1 Tax=Vibrio agarilyticus TaxID=2726741 RepID=A0A7X8YGJ6_9VIBR|nr:alpha-galactosidase [Vibrio agarilyticus]NLS13043.1 glycosyl hydrolase [Vibrio agarilyticus]